MKTRIISIFILYTASFLFFGFISLMLILGNCISIGCDIQDFRFGLGPTFSFGMIIGTLMSLSLIFSSTEE